MELFLKELEVRDNMRQIRVLQVVTYMGRGGLETMLMNYYRKIDREKILFDFLVHRDFEADYDEEIRQLGGRIYRLSRLNPISRGYLNQLDDFFKEHPEYKIVHSHLDCMAGIPLKYAQKNNVSARIAHAHSSNQTRDKKYVLKQFYKHIIPKYATHFFACSEVAGKWMFGKQKFSVLNNAIDTQKYSYNPQTARRVRAELKVSEDTLMVGHVGRFHPPKNHEMIVKIFSEVLKRVSDAKLLLVGDGYLQHIVQDQVAALGIQDHVIFTGVRSDVCDLMQAMDIFLFPSLYEGLPVSIIEAQAAGLPCIISDKVPLECKKTDLVQQLNLSESFGTWADIVISAAKQNKRRDTAEEIKKAGFDVSENTRRLEEFYLNVYENAVEEERANDFINHIYPGI